MKNSQIHRMTGANGAQVTAPGLGESQRAVLGALKRRGAATVPLLARGLGLNVETVRHHVQSLMTRGLVERRGQRNGGRGRPEVLYGLSAEAEPLFPRREADVLRGLVEYLAVHGHEPLLLSFFEQYVATRREEQLARVAHLRGAARTRAVARILTELGFVAEVADGELRLCHCPVRAVAEVTSAPCRAEIGFVQELLGNGLTRATHIPAGDASCTYRCTGAES